MMRRRRPLMRGAMVAGGAYAVGKNNQKKRAAEADQNQQIADLQAQQAAQQAPAPPPAAPAPPAAPTGESVVDQLTKLKGLLDAGVLTQDEFDAQKARILAA